MFKIEWNKLTITSSFLDKETNKEIEFKSIYKIADGIQEETITEWLGNQNPDFLNKNIKDYLIPNGIVSESGNKKLIADMLNQLA